MSLPYLPPDQVIQYVPAEHPFMIAAREASSASHDPEHPTGAVIVLDGEIIGTGANGSDWHGEHGCERKKQNIPTGEGYELCPGCHPDNHAERSAIQNCRAKGNDCQNADLYLWGHWWCCRWCWEAMIEAEIGDVYLVEGAEEQFG